MTYALQRDDENYLEIVEKYDNTQEQGNREIDYFTQAFGLLQEGMAEVNHDILGVVYEEMGHSSDAFGQHFTPHNLCDAKAEMLISDIDEDREVPYKVQDPACGSGRLLISAAKQLPADAEFYGVDKDSTCAKMTALNLCFFNMNGYAIRGDSLTMDYTSVWSTNRTMLGGEIRELDSSEFENPYETVKQEVEQETSEPETETAVSTESINRQHSQDIDFTELRETTLSDFGETAADGGDTQ